MSRSRTQPLSGPRSHRDPTENSRDGWEEGRKNRLRNETRSQRVDPLPPPLKVPTTPSLVDSDRTRQGSSPRRLFGHPDEVRPPPLTVEVTHTQTRPIFIGSFVLPRPLVSGGGVLLSGPVCVCKNVCPGKVNTHTHTTHTGPTYESYTHPSRNPSAVSTRPRALSTFQTRTSPTEVVQEKSRDLLRPQSGRLEIPTAPGTSGEWTEVH